MFRLAAGGPSSLAWREGRRTPTRGGQAMTSLMRRLAAAAGLAAMMALPAAAETVFHRGNSADPETLDQHKTSTVYEAHILQDLYEGLVTYDAGARVIPGVAESWTLSPDGRVYTFRLRGNAKWSNG